MRILVSGANGFLGAHAAAVASRSGAKVAGVDLPDTLQRAERIRASLGAPGLAVREADLSARGAWFDLLKDIRPHAVLHLAGVTRRGNTKRDRELNQRGNVEPARALLHGVSGLSSANRPVVVYAGSQMEYGLAAPPWTEATPCLPTSPYALSKLETTTMLLAASDSGACRACVGRLPLVFGPGQPPTMFVAELICKALDGIEFKMTEGRQRRRFVHAADAVRFLLDLARDLWRRRDLPAVLNAPALEPVAMRDVAERIVRALGTPVRLEIGALPQREGELQEAWPSDALARSLGFSCSMAFDDGLRDTVAWYRDQPWFRAEIAS
jgi:nucleoside-diphosphate-sugar epimerase